MNCFDINDPEISKRLITQNELAFAFPSNMPIVPGHTLICPKRHSSIIDQLEVEELLAIISLLTQLKKAMKKALGAEGFNCAWNEEVMAGQSVPHLHLHLLPRK